MASSKLDSKVFISNQIELILKLCDLEQNDNHQILKTTIVEQYPDTKKIDQIGITAIRNEPSQFAETIDLSTDSRIHHLASDIMREKLAFVILVGGTSGCGKSSLSVSVANRLGGICHVISTDMIRHVLRYLNNTPSPLLWASSYNGTEAYRQLHPEDTSDLVLKSYEAQCDIMLPWLQKIVWNCIKHNEPTILEGVHLSPLIIKKITSYVSSQNTNGILFPMIVYTSDEKEHFSRFAGRAQDKYTKYFDNIRKINDYMKTQASALEIAYVNNSNRSIEDTTSEILDLFAMKLAHSS